MSELNFKVAPTWGGDYNSATSFDILTEVRDPQGSGIYRSLQKGNVGHPLTDQAWWECICDLQNVSTAVANCEEITITANTEEGKRQAAEIIREQQRHTVESAEQSRMTAESLRASNESARQSEEVKRISAETKRSSSETQRILNESDRQTQESTRQTQESTRQTQETSRNIAENGRTSAEQTRNANEATRQSGEAARNTAYMEAEGDTSQSASATGSRWQQFKAAESVRNKEVSDSIADFPTVKSETERIMRDIGYSAKSTEVTITPGIDGKYVQASTRSAITNTDFAISSPITVDACSEILIKTGFNPSDSDHSSLDLSIISFVHTIDRQRQTQKKDANGNLLYYEVIETTDSEGMKNTTVTTTETTTISAYPVYVTETYQDTVYTPNNEDKYVSIPDSGYYVANIPDNAQIVISYKKNVTDMKIIIVKHGNFANIVSQLGMLAFKERLPMVQSIAQLYEDIQGLRNLLSQCIVNQQKIPTVNNTPLILIGNGIPSADTKPSNWPSSIPWDGVPVFIGQIYLNITATSGGAYHAVGNESIANWIS